ncbi:TetR/AcrR family transcriptional regulator [uncultured Desulfosarcina sp.]|uniref:TetR/AcrR family transcriptional regulator n=1 Tax=uncultured Desulfosarcina sp. TaxID=218289 RepID=UPI0029C9698F|nr:TetR/AcrR family transcriptional regulator [uncultured Desulfosarcina sp.]
MDDKRERTRQQLVSAAIDVFHDNGFQNTRISDIVARAGLAQGTFYLHFKSKENIFNHICSEFKTMFLNLLDRSAADMFAGDCVEAVRSSLKAFNRELIALFAANYKMAQLLFVEGRSYRGTFAQLFESIYAAFIEKIVAHLAIGREKGHIAFDDAETEAAFLIGLFDSSLFYFLRIRNQIDIDALSVRMTDFMLGGLSKRQ